MSEERLMTEENSNVAVDSKTLYQLLVESCRYGYTRNNHLMPHGAFQTCREYLPLMKEVDPECAVRTAVQLADEAIEEVTTEAGRDPDRRCNFQVNIPEEETSRNIVSEWWPGAYDFIASTGIMLRKGITVTTGYIQAGDQPILEVVEVDDGLMLVGAECPYDRKFDFRVYEKTGHAKFTSIPKYLWSDKRFKEGDIITVEMRRDYFIRNFDYKEYITFIEWLLKFVKDMGRSDVPYNIAYYKRFLGKHPLPGQFADDCEFERRIEEEVVE